MSRIRSIKPQFFTSEDIVRLSPLARLLYIAVWCEADKEGRLVWRPRTLKMRYLPGDDCDIDALCGELTDAGVVRLYGDGLAYVPSFAEHQHINPRESASKLPQPPVDNDASRRVGTRADPELTGQIQDCTHREEGKGREGKGKEDASATRDDASRPFLNSCFGFPRDGSVAYSPWADLIRTNARGADVDVIAAEFRKFCRTRDIPLDGQSIGKTLSTFCKKQRGQGVRA